MVNRIVFFLYGVIAYLAFFVTILYAIGFTTGLVVPKTINDGVEGSFSSAILINVLLLALFAVQHTIMARPGFKRAWAKSISPVIERSTFVLIASLLLALIMWQWRPISTVVWQVDQPVVRDALLILGFVGWAMVFYASFLIDHFDLFGLRQVYLHLQQRPYTHPQYMARSLYRYIRHPLMAGFLIAFWVAPTMTQGHLLFCVVTTIYILFGTTIEERDLLRMLGDDYQQYRRRTPRLVPLPKRRSSDDGA